MGFFDIFKKEKRSVGLVASALSASGYPVTPDSAMRISTVYSCVSLLSQTIGSLPVVLMREDPNGKKDKALEHPLYPLLKYAPNEIMAPKDLLEAIVSSLLLRGNAYVRIYRGLDGHVSALVPISPDKVTVAPSPDRTTFLYTVEGETRPLRLGEIWAIKGLTLDGQTGISPIGYNAGTFARARATDNAANACFENVATPSGIITTAGEVSVEERQGILAAWKEAHSGANTGNTALLPPGFDYKPLTLSAPDFGFVESQKLSRDEICGIFRVPPHMVANMDRATWSNVESMGSAFVTYSLRTWIVAIEQSFARDVLLVPERSRYFLKINVDGLLRGDLLARMQAAQIAIMNGIRSPNEIRALEDLNPYDGGDIYLTPVNLQAVDPQKVDFSATGSQAARIF